MTARCLQRSAAAFAATLLAVTGTAAAEEAAEAGGAYRGNHCYRPEACTKHSGRTYLHECFWPRRHQGSGLDGYHPGRQPVAQPRDQVPLGQFDARLHHPRRRHAELSGQRYAQCWPVPRRGVPDLHGRDGRSLIRHRARGGDQGAAGRCFRAQYERRGSQLLYPQTQPGSERLRARKLRQVGKVRSPGRGGRSARREPVRPIKPVVRPAGRRLGIQSDHRQRCRCSGHSVGPGATALGTRRRLQRQLQDIRQPGPVPAGLFPAHRLSRQSESVRRIVPSLSRRPPGSGHLRRLRRLQR